jgi:methionine-rich copper-binding protein CopC
MRTPRGLIPAPPAFLLALVLVLAAPGLVAAHAELISTDPEAGSAVEGTPERIVAVFSEELEPDPSSIQLRDPAGDTVATGAVDPDDPTRLVITDVPVLEPGEYQIRWTAVGDDGHLERGRYSFTVVAALTPEPSPSPTPEPTVTAPPATEAPTEAPTASPEPSPTPDDSDPAAGTTDVLLPILAVLVILGVLAAALLRRRGASPRP